MPIREQVATRNLPVKLTTEELETRSRELAEKIQEEDGLRQDFITWEARMKDAKKAKESGVRLAHAEASRLAGIVESGQEHRNVTCSWLYALAAGRAFLVRDDTGELVTTRVLPDDERQEDLRESLREPTPQQLGQWLGLPAEPAAEESVS